MIKTLSFGLLVVLLERVSAQTAPGFPIQAPGQGLNVTFGTNNVSPPGELIPRADTASPPNITAPVWTTGERGILMMVDSDVPRNGTRVELLHWLASGVTLGDDNQTLSVPSDPEASYRQPSPPVGDVPHAYTFLLFSEPENFTVPEQFNDVLESRIFFNTSNFVAAAGLAQPIAANYIRVQNLTGTPTTTFPPPRPTNESTTNATSTPMPSPGTAPLVLGGGKAFWVGVGMALIAGVGAFAL